MIAVALDPALVPIAVAGRGEAAQRRIQTLRAAGAEAARLFADRLPTPNELAALKALWIVGLADEEAAELAALARAKGALVNVEDRPALSDFHNVAEVRRGELLLTVSTGGASPALAARIRARLADQYGPEWEGRTALMRRLRETWRDDRLAPAEIAKRTGAVLDSKGWLE
jgi:precorrin-2 dehydrogenase/sirohydrochlorin ferrochelatase